MPEQSLDDKFQQLFDCKPELVVAAPGRVNLIGDHTDYNQGLVLPAAIQMATTIAISRRDDRKVLTFAEEFTLTIDQFSLDSIEFCDTEAWPNYIRGTFKCLHDYTNHFSGANILIRGEVPQGAGLSSSASVEIALLRAISKLYKINLEGIDAALIGQLVENTFVGCNCGIMDQLVSAMGLEGHAMLLDCRDLNYKDIPIPEGIVILIINSNVQRELVDSQYNSRRKQCEEVATILNISTLRNLTLQHLNDSKELLSDEQFRRGRHVISENSRVKNAAKALEIGDLKSLGELMKNSHASLRDDYEVSTKELDYLVDIVSAELGSVGGARMTGGGFGGCVVAIMPIAKVPAVISVVKSHYSKFSGFEEDIYQCTASMGAFRNRRSE